MDLPFPELEKSRGFNHPPNQQSDDIHHRVLLHLWPPNAGLILFEFRLLSSHIFFFHLCQITCGWPRRVAFAFSRLKLITTTMPPVSEKSNLMGGLSVHVNCPCFEEGGNHLDLGSAVGSGYLFWTKAWIGGYLPFCCRTFLVLSGSGQQLPTSPWSPTVIFFQLLRQDRSTKELLRLTLAWKSTRTANLLPV
jgi:hypothetical protein